MIKNAYCLILWIACSLSSIAQDFSGVPGPEFTPNPFSTAVTGARAIDEILGATSYGVIVRLNRWQQKDWGEFRGFGWIATKEIRLNHFTGDYVYTTYIRQWVKNIEQDEIFVRNVFELDSINRLNFKCSQNDYGYSGNWANQNKVEDFDVAVNAVNISQSGLFPPRGPFEAWANFRATQIQNNCFAVDPKYFNAIVRLSVDLKSTTVVKPTLVNYRYDWPPSVNTKDVIYSFGK